MNKGFQCCLPDIDQPQYTSEATLKDMGKSAHIFYVRYLRKLMSQNILKVICFADGEVHFMCLAMLSYHCHICISKTLNVTVKRRHELLIQQNSYKVDFGKILRIICLSVFRSALIWYYFQHFIKQRCVAAWSTRETLNANRAPSQYKDRLIYVWRFPC